MYYIVVCRVILGIPVTCQVPAPFNLLLPGVWSVPHKELATIPGLSGLPIKYRSLLAKAMQDPVNLRYREFVVYHDDQGASTPYSLLTPNPGDVVTGRAFHVQSIQNFCLAFAA